jgi:ribosomal 50S subunit-recycling heat shock protein
LSSFTCFRGNFSTESAGLISDHGFAIVKHSFLRYNNFVRLDLFLKTSRLIKRRTVARAMCDSNRVLVNGSKAKPAKEVKQGDAVTLKFSARVIELEIVRLPATPSRKPPPDELYRILSDTRLPKEKDLWNENLSSS